MKAFNKALVIMMLSVFLVACTNENDEIIPAPSADNSNNNNTETNVINIETNIEVNDELTKLQEEYDPDLVREHIPIDFTSYGEEINLTFTSPEFSNETYHTDFKIEGSIGDWEGLQKDNIWIEMSYLGSAEDYIPTNFSYFTSIDEGSFQEDLKFFAGQGRYYITIRTPSKEEGNSRYYDAAMITLANLDEEVTSDVEYRASALENGLNISEPSEGIFTADGFFELEGTVPGSENNHFVMIEVKTRDNSTDFFIPITDETFSETVPLHFGKGAHEIIVKVFNEEDELYYDSASFVVNNERDETFVQMTEYLDYFERGIKVTEPSRSLPERYEGETYRIAGTIDPDAEHADIISHIIVKTEYEDIESTYYLPVEDYQFDDEIPFRFGDGTYSIVLNVPKVEQEMTGFFQFNSVIEFQHEVTGAEDLRSLLPSRGIQSDDERIISLAKDLTSGMESDRDKTEVLFKYVAESISYDVKKFNEDLFELDDSALKTLDMGTGVCQDYAFLLVALLRAIDIEANFIDGIAGGRHAWVEALLSDEWVTMDPTWASGYITPDDEFVHDYNDDYFDPDPAFFEETHVRYGVIY